VLSWYLQRWRMKATIIMTTN